MLIWVSMCGRVVVFSLWILMFFGLLMMFFGVVVMFLLFLSLIILVLFSRSRVWLLLVVLLGIIMVVLEGSLLSFLYLFE